MTMQLSAGQVIGERYTVSEYLGEGGMQYVYSAHDEVTGRSVALKTPKNLSAQKRFKRSAIVAAKVNHPNVAKTLDYVKEGDRRYLIEELVAGKDLKAALLDRVGMLDPYLVAKLFHHLSKGVAAAHHAGVIHRDLKPTNIMIVGGFGLAELKITDFGIAKMAEEVIKESIDAGIETMTMTNSQTAVGALPYMSPEAIDAPESIRKSSDIWSVGAMLYQLLSGELPFGQGLRAVPNIMSATTKPLSPLITANPQFKPLAEELIRICFLCLKKDQAERPSADDLVMMCGDLCYSFSERKEGVVNNFLHASYGFITAEADERVFYHKDCVYGELPSIGDPVLFASHRGGRNSRALPVIKLIG